MSLIDAPRLQQVKHIADDSVRAISALYADLMTLILRLASVGVIHGDFNEFNILIHTSSVTPPSQSSSSSPSTHPENFAQAPKIKPYIIDFPQLLSLSHPNAESYFLRDVNCIKTFFYRRFGYTSDESGPGFKDALKAVEGTKWEDRLDVNVEAAGFTKKMGKELEGWVLGDQREEREEGEDAGKGVDSGESDDASEDDEANIKNPSTEDLRLPSQSQDALSQHEDKEQTVLPHRQVPPVSTFATEAVNG